MSVGPAEFLAGGSVALGQAEDRERAGSGKPVMLVIRLSATVNTMMP